MTKSIKKSSAADYALVARQVDADTHFADPMATAVAVSYGSSGVANDQGAAAPLVVASPIPHAASSQNRQHFTMTAIDSPTMPAYFKVQAPVAAPKGMTVLHEKGALTIKRKWNTSDISVIMCFAIVWNGFLLVWNYIFLTSGADGIGPALFAIPHDCIGLWLIYSINRTLRNSTYVTAEDGTITVETLPIQGCDETKILDIRPIREIRCKRNVNVSSDEDRTIHIDYDVRALDVNRVEKVIVDNLASLEEALFFEQELERFLGVGEATVDATVVGEVV